MSRFESSPVVKSFRGNVRSLQLPDSPHFICGVSGGIDSMTLLFLLHRHNMNCTVVHCNYGLRGEESDKDRDLVEQISAMWNFECVTAAFDPANADDKNTQAWAREKRYRVFRDIMNEVGADYIMTAHHQTDQVETILQKILRGAGLQAWKGIDLMEGDLIRPLISVTKQQIRDFAGKHQVPYREDHTNKTPDYARNFMRQELAPDMDRFFPGWRQNVLKIPQRAEEYEIMLEMLLQTVLNDRKQVIREKLLDVPRQLWPALFYRFLEKKLPETTMTEGILTRFRSIDELQTGAEIEVDSEWKIVRNRNVFELVSRKGATGKEEINITKENLNQQVELFDYRLKITGWSGTINTNLLQLDADKLTWPITLRRWHNGDRIQVLGMQGTRTVADVLTDKKISSSQKREAILIESFDGIVSAVIFPHNAAGGQPGVISELVKCNSDTEQVLEIDTDL